MHDHEFIELNYGYHCCADCGEIGTLLSLSLSDIITFNSVFNFMHFNPQNNQISFS
jgi:energy-converting hydrogenase Eha subunit B